LFLNKALFACPWKIPATPWKNQIKHWRQSWKKNLVYRLFSRFDNETPMKRNKITILYFQDAQASLSSQNVKVVCASKQRITLTYWKVATFKISTHILK